MYAVEFASAKRIRLSVNFQEADSIPLLEGVARVSEKKTKVSFDLDAERTSNNKVKVEPATVVEMKQEKQESEVVPAPGASSHDLKTLLNEDVKMEDDVHKEQPTVVVSTVTVVEDAAPFKPQSPPAAPPPAIPASRKMDISMLCASASPSSDDGDVKQEAFVKAVDNNGDVRHGELQANGQATKEDVTTIETTLVTHAPTMKTSPTSDGDVSMDSAAKTDTNDSREASTASPTVAPPVPTDEKRGAGKDSNKTAANHEHDNHSHSLTRVGSKKRMIIDDDTTNSSSESGSDAATEKKQKRTKKQRSSSDPALDSTGAQSPPAKKRRKVSVSPQADEKVTQPTTEQPVTEADKRHSSPSTPAAPTVNGVVASDTEPKAAADTEPVKPDDATATTDSFEVTCASCTKLYDMRYLDPPLLERPVGEWRCFECLVNDARGWPRRRKSVARGSHSENETHDERSSGKTRRRPSSSKPRSSSSSSKKKSGTSSSKTSKSRSSSKSKSSSSSKHKKSSSSHSSSTKKSSSTSSSRKHKRKSSTTSSHHHSSSSHHHKSRRHHRHNPEQFSKLVDAFRVRQSQRRALEDARMQDEMCDVYLEGPSGWRVASSTLDELRQLVASLAGGSLEQDRCACLFFPL